MKKTGLDIPSCLECTNKNSVFCCLTKEDKEIITDRKGSNFFKKGQVIFYEGNHPHGLFCIHKGKVKISKLGEEGKEQVVRFAGTGELLGYRSILSNESYNATATALEDSHVCLISKDKFMDVLNKNNNFSMEIIKMLSADLRNSEQHLINISQKTVRERVAETLLLLKEKFGLESDNKTLSLSLTRREIGDIAGISTETTIRTLSDMNKDGLIELKGKSIIIKDMKGLIAEANILD